MYRIVNINIVVLLLTTAAFTGTALSATPEPAPSAEATASPRVNSPSPGKEFNDALQDLSKTIDEAASGIDNAQKAVNDVQHKSAKDYDADVSDLRNKLLRLGGKLQTGSQLADTVQHFQTWAAQQEKRIEDHPEQFTEPLRSTLINKYRQMQQKSADAMSAMEDTKKLIDQTLTDLNRAGLDMDELFLALEGEKAINQLIDMVGKAKSAVEELRKRYAPALAPQPGV